jgi:hypothetical protein
MEIGWAALNEFACEDTEQMDLGRCDPYGLEGIAAAMEIGWSAMDTTTPDAQSRSTRASMFSCLDQEMSNYSSSGLEAIGATMALGWGAIDKFDFEISNDQESGQGNPFGLAGTGAAMKMGWGAISAF